MPGELDWDIEEEILLACGAWDERQQRDGAAEEVTEFHRGTVGVRVIGACWRDRSNPTANPPIGKEAIWPVLPLSKELMVPEKVLRRRRTVFLLAIRLKTALGVKRRGAENECYWA
jgi:hypothetical protein